MPDFRTPPAPGAIGRDGARVPMDEPRPDGAGA